MARPLAVAAALLLAGCTGARAAAWVPRLVVRGALVHRRGAGPDRASERWDWRVEAGLRWRPGGARPRPPPPAAPKVEALSGEAPELPCLDPALCAWERRARARALAPHRRAPSPPTGGRP